MSYKIFTQRYAFSVYKSVYEPLLYSTLTKPVREKAPAGRLEEVRTRQRV